MTRTLILGGSGLLGQHVALAALERGDDVALVGFGDPVPLLPAIAHLPVRSLDVWGATPDALAALVAGFDAVVYALGPDDREHRPAPVSVFFTRFLVEPTERVAAACAAGGVGRLVVLGSYFTAWARMNPGFAARHPYVQARQHQARRAIAAGGGRAAGGTDVAVLEIPYVFGTVPGQVPMWRTWLYERLRAMPVVLYPDGGTSVVTAAQVGVAAANAAHVGGHGRHYPLADEQWTWPELLAHVLPALGRSPRVITVPRPLAEPAAKAMGRELARDGLESGLDPDWVMRDLMYQRLFVDPGAARTELGLPRGGVPEAIAASVAASYPDGVPGRRP